MTIEIVDLPIIRIKHGDFPQFCYKLPEGSDKKIAKSCEISVWYFYVFQTCFPVFLFIWATVKIPKVGISIFTSKFMLGI